MDAESTAGDANVVGPRDAAVAHGADDARRDLDRHPGAERAAQHLQVLLRRLRHPVGVVPDLGLGRVQRAHGVDVAGLDGGEQTVGDGE